MATPQSRDGAGLAVDFSPLTDPAALAGRWRGLEARADGGFFLSWAWIASWLTTVPETPYLVSVRQDGNVVALGLLHPAHERRHGILSSRQFRLHHVGDADHDAIAIEYNGLLAARGQEVAAFQAVLRRLSSDTTEAPPLGDWDEVVFANVRSELLAPAEAAGTPLVLLASAPTYAVALDDVRQAGGDWLATTSRNFRQGARRAIRRYEEIGALATDRAGSVDEALAYLGELKGFHQKRWQSQGQGGAFSHRWFEPFHYRLIETAFADGRIDLLRFRAGERTIGYHYNLRDRGTVHYYMSGYDYPANNQMRPGLVCHHQAIQHYLDKNAATYDLMAGEARYKASMARPGPSLVSFALQRPRLRFRIEAALRCCKRALTG